MSSDRSLADQSWWCWIVLASSFFVTFSIDGWGFSFGILKLAIENEYDGIISKETIALIGGIYPALYSILAPFAFGLVAVYSVRTLTLVGSFISTFGFVLGFVNQYLVINEQLSFVIDFIALGVLQGIASATLFGPAISYIPTYYFPTERRSLATGITMCGSPAGAIFYGFVIHFLIEFFTWRGSLLFFALGSGLISVAAFAYLKKTETETSGEEILKKSIKQKFLDEFKVIFSTKLFSDPVFIAMLICVDLSMLGYFVPMLLITEQAKTAEFQVSTTVQNILILLWGVAQLIGRVFIGWLADFGVYTPVLSTFSLFVTGLLMSSICVLVFPYFMIYGDIAFVTFIVLYGLASAPFTTLQSPIMQDLYFDQKELVFSSFGWVLSAVGIIVVGGFYLPTLLNNFGPFYAYLFSSICFFLSAMVLFIALPKFRKMYRLKQQEYFRLGSETESQSESGTDDDDDDDDESVNELRFGDDRLVTV